MLRWYHGGVLHEKKPLLQNITDAGPLYGAAGGIKAAG